MDARSARMAALVVLVSLPPGAVAADAGSGTPAPDRGVASGPLRAHDKNPRWFADGAGRAVLLTGSHTWPSLVDMSPADPPERFDFDAFLEFLVRHDHNFMRLWTWELTTWNTKANGEERVHRARPQPWARSGPGDALDGKLKFDLAKYDAEYFERLRARVSAAGKRGVYVSVMLFEGWGLQFCDDAWKYHPFNPRNNVQGLDGDSSGDGKGLEVHELASRKVTEIQEAYVRHVVDTVGDLDNVLYEISNENHPPSTQWQYHMIRLIHEYEKGKPRQHPVGMTFQYKGGANAALFDGPADWVSPNPDGGYRDDPPASDGKKVILSDTDHLWGIGGNVAWVWKTFCRGMNPLFMDPYDGKVLGSGDPWEPVRKNLGYALDLARRVDLATMAPRDGLSSTGYCLADPANEYVAFAPSGGKFAVDLSGARGRMRVEWIEPATGKKTEGAAVEGGARREFQAPFDGAAVLHLRREAAGGTGR